MQERFAAIFGVLAFVLVILRGLVQGGAFDEVMLAALVALLVFTLIGWGLGRIGARLVGEHIQRHEPPAPVADESAPESAAPPPADETPGVPAPAPDRSPALPPAAPQAARTGGPARGG